ncbi:hypothetical protein GCM10010519_01260 [Streptomyces lactacystinicus]
MGRAGPIYAGGRPGDCGRYEYTLPRIHSVKQFYIGLDLPVCAEKRGCSGRSRSSREGWSEDGMPLAERVGDPA